MSPTWPGARPLRARLADRSFRQTNPLLAVAAHLLELAGSRVTAAQVLDFASRGPVSPAVSASSQDDLSQVERWLAGTGTRWGLDATASSALEAGRLATGTWRAGHRPALVGRGHGEEGERLFGGTLPFGDISSGEIDLAGRFAELVERLGVTLGELKGRRRPGAGPGAGRGHRQAGCAAPG